MRIEEGQRILISILGLHYDAEHFPNPEKFDPERFSEQNRTNIKPYTFMPFGEGPRNCIGLCEVYFFVYLIFDLTAF